MGNAHAWYVSHPGSGLQDMPRFPRLMDLVPWGRGKLWLEPSLSILQGLKS
jgi:hypothetical protein